MKYKYAPRLLTEDMSKLWYAIVAAINVIGMCPDCMSENFMSGGNPYIGHKYDCELGNAIKRLGEALEIKHNAQ